VSVIWAAECEELDNEMRTKSGSAAGVAAAFRNVPCAASSHTSTVNAATPTQIGANVRSDEVLDMTSRETTRQGRDRLHGEAGVARGSSRPHELLA
jgi:hypothetical protein